MNGQKIEYGLALSIAGQVAAGLAQGDGQEARAVTALHGIGLMLLTATRDFPDSAVKDVLNVASDTHVTIRDGQIIVTVAGEQTAAYEEQPSA